MQSNQQRQYNNDRVSPETRSSLQNPNKNVYKIYNTTFHDFGYEQTQQQKRTFHEMFADKSTPSNLSDQSLIGSSDGNILCLPI